MALDFTVIVALSLGNTLQLEPFLHHCFSLSKLFLECHCLLFLHSSHSLNLLSSQIALFVGVLSFSTAVMHNVEIGLDQSLSMPHVSVKIMSLLSNLRLNGKLEILLCLLNIM